MTMLLRASTMAVLVCSGVLAAPGSRPHFFDPARLQQMEGVSPTRKAELAILFLEEEIARPSAPRRTPDGDTFGHAEVLVAIASLAMEQRPDLDVIRARAKAAQGPCRHVLTLMLGIARDEAARETLGTVFCDPAQPGAFRRLAGDLLEAQVKASDVPAVLGVLKHDATSKVAPVRDPRTLGTIGYRRVYPQRRQALRILEQHQRDRGTLPPEIRAAMATSVVEEPFIPVGDRTHARRRTLRDDAHKSSR
jgi:hypothetical protein